MKKMDNSIKITLIISAVVVFLAILGFAAMTSLNPSQSNTVSVSGQSSIDVTPDLISVYFNIETKGDTSKEANDANSVIYDKLINNLALLEISEEEVKTEYLNIYQDYIWTEDGREDNGFIASHGVKIEFNLSELDKVTKVIDAGVKAGAGVSNINFELSEKIQSESKAKAIEQAAGDARIKAEAVASGFNKKVGNLVSTSVDEYYYSPWGLYEGRTDIAVSENAAMAKEAMANIQPSEQEVSARVTAVFKLI